MPYPKGENMGNGMNEPYPMPIPPPRIAPGFGACLDWPPMPLGALILGALLKLEPPILPPDRPASAHSGEIASMVNTLPAIIAASAKLKPIGIFFSDTYASLLFLSAATGATRTEVVGDTTRDLTAAPAKGARLAATGARIVWRETAEAVMEAIADVGF